MALDFSSNDKGDILEMVENFLKELMISDDYYCDKCKSIYILLCRTTPLSKKN
jgi:hypothetical protein